MQWCVEGGGGDGDEGEVQMHYKTIRDATCFVGGVSVAAAK